MPFETRGGAVLGYHCGAPFRLCLSITSSFKPALFNRVAPHRPSIDALDRGPERVAPAQCHSRCLSIHVLTVDVDCCLRTAARTIAVATPTTTATTTTWFHHHTASSHRCKPPAPLPPHQRSRRHGRHEPEPSHRERCGGIERNSSNGRAHGLLEGLHVTCHIVALRLVRSQLAFR